MIILEVVPFRKPLFIMYINVEYLNANLTWAHRLSCFLKRHVQGLQLPHRIKFFPCAMPLILYLCSTCFMRLNWPWLFLWGFLEAFICAQIASSSSFLLYGFSSSLTYRSSYVKLAAHSRLFYSSKCHHTLLENYVFGFVMLEKMKNVEINFYNPCIFSSQ